MATQLAASVTREQQIGFSSGARRSDSTVAAPAEIGGARLHSGAAGSAPWPAVAVSRPDLERLV